MMAATATHIPPYPWLVADVGGTNARFAIVEGPGQPPAQLQVLHSDDFPAFQDALRHYLADAGANRPRAAVIAVAGPVTSDQVRFTNHPWSFSITATRRQMQFERLLVINDFTALALAVPGLDPDNTRVVAAGQAVSGAPLALIGPGTGLGVSGLLPIGSSWLPLSGEGGHVTLAPGNARESALLDIVRQNLSHVSAENLLSGSGLPTLYRAVATLDGYQPIAEATPEMITEQALNRGDYLSVETCNSFCSLLGVVAGNLVLTLGARGGLYIGGGIVPKLGQFFDQSPFLASFTRKGRYTAYLTAVPVHVITASTAALSGAAEAFAVFPNDPPA